MSKVKTLAWVVVLGLGLVALVPAGGAAAEPFPTRPITFIIGFPPGGATDLTFRPLLEATSKVLGQPVVPVNKPGASGTLGPSSLKAMKPDGYTLAMGVMTLLTLPHMQDVAFDPMKDFTHIIRTHRSEFGILVRADAPWRTLKDLVEHARQHPNEIKYSTSTPGNVHQFAMEEIARKEGVRWNMVPYPGGPQAIAALLGGHVHAASQDFPSSMPHVLAGKLRLLAVFGTERVKRFPEVPTLPELGYSSWTAPLGVLGPAGMDPAVVKVLHDAVRKAMADATYLKTLEMLETFTAYLNGEDYQRFMRESYARFGEAIRGAGLEKKK